MKKYSFLVLSLMLLFGCNSTDNSKKLTLKDAYKNMFFIGTALHEKQITGEDESSVNVIKSNFNSITAENIMKSEIMQPQEGEFDFTLADKFVEFGEQNGMNIIGHTLIWHSQAPSWFFIDDEGNDVAPEVLKERMKTHISTIVSRYKGRIE